MNTSYGSYSSVVTTADVYSPNESKCSCGGDLCIVEASLVCTSCGVVHTDHYVFSDSIDNGHQQPRTVDAPAIQDNTREAIESKLRVSSDSMHVTSRDKYIATYMHTIRFYCSKAIVPKHVEEKAAVFWGMLNSIVDKNMDEHNQKPSLEERESKRRRLSCSDGVCGCIFKNPKCVGLCIGQEHRHKKADELIKMHNGSYVVAALIVIAGLMFKCKEALLEPFAFHAGLDSVCLLRFVDRTFHRLSSKHQLRIFYWDIVRLFIVQRKQAIFQATQNTIGQAHEIHDRALAIHAQLSSARTMNDSHFDSIDALLRCSDDTERDNDRLLSASSYLPVNEVIQYDTDNLRVLSLAYNRAKVCAASITLVAMQAASLIDRITVSSSSASSKIKCKRKKHTLGRPKKTQTTTTNTVANFMDVVLRYFPECKPTTLRNVRVLVCDIVDKILKLDIR